ncbi:chloroplast envelope quinone oxidoreductase homolog [Triticum dicoccoides]|uniref:chloroplast envelope quinone oxidoreductase homolog n=1 Tax=Triticum dicoccoides TaxID=85692 RepID=UPI00189130CE|nr:chloroplast envelope quinone oxidoreductase homolog [Triticum dicoccoides]
MTTPTTTPAKMRAVLYDACGGGAASLKHVEVPVPSAKKNEVLLKLQAATVNPLDWKIQKGDLRPLLPRRLPFIPVTDVAGVIVDVGPGVNGLTAGDQVVAKLNSLNGGGLAEYAVAPANLTVKRPAKVSAAEGAGLPIAAGTALQALRSIGAKFDGTGKPLNVLITAASGGVGLYAVQLAKLANLHVTATCGARNMDLVKSLGADEVMDYRTPEGATLQSPFGRKYDGVVHCTVGVSWSSFQLLLSDAGRVIDITPNLSAILTYVLHRVTFSKKRLVPQLLLSLNKADLEFLVGLLEEGKLKTVIDSRFLLSDAGKAWQSSIDGHATGKIVVEMES